MERNVMDILRERGFIKQVVFEEDLYKLLGEQSVPFYVGFDPTADSLHVGHYLALMAMSHMQKAGHKPFVLVGGGTGKVGDPSGRTDMRQMMTDEIIKHNCDCFRKQMSKFFTFDGKNGAVMVDNGDWLLQLNYIDFLREVGVHFSVNRMLSAECFKSRMEKGLSFFEFNYMLMQSYDFLYLFNKYGVTLQCGGDDQWSNILSGADLIRRKESKPAFAMTFQLLTTSEGKKMGKSQKGAVWLDRSKTTPYEFYQYWRNIEDGDVEKCLKLLTYMDVAEIAALCEHKDERMNIAKEHLAYEVTMIVHTQADADAARAQAQASFVTLDDSQLPISKIDKGINSLADIMVTVKIAGSKGEAKRLIEGGGVKIGDDKVSDIMMTITDEQLAAGVVIHKGKKVHVKVSNL